MLNVVYFSKCGKTKRAAEAIADKLGTKARDINSVDSLDEDSIILLGSGFYGSVHRLNNSSVLWIETDCREEKSSSLPRLQPAGARS
jgi:flavodoxin